MKNEWDYEPAKDLGLSASERMKSLDREPGIFQNLINSLFWSVAKTYLRIFHSYQIVNADRLSIEPPFILIANHASHLDVVTLATALPTKQWGRVYAVAAEDHFFAKTLMSYFSALAINALPMPRRGGGSRAIKIIRERLEKQCYGLIIFPEGTRSRDGNMSAFKSGVGMLAAGNSLKVIPCYIDGAYEAFPADRFLPRPRKIKLLVGQPQSFEATPNTPEGWRQIAADLQQGVETLRAESANLRS